MHGHNLLLMTVTDLLQEVQGACTPYDEQGLSYKTDREYNFSFPDIKDCFSHQIGYKG